MVASESNTNQGNELPTEKLTWAVLLGRWVSFARSAKALPEGPDGQRMRAIVPDVIMLQAVWFALQHMDELDANQSALGLDRAELLIEKHCESIGQAFDGDTLPNALVELVDDARSQLQAVRERIM